ncbi:MAG: GGDEF domain-containing protein [Dehalococcoidia bacterium]
MLRRFGFSRDDRTENDAPVDGRPPQSEEDAAVDTVAAMLRTLGGASLPVESPALADFREQCEGWASHLLVKTPVPNAPQGVSSKRDWAGVRMFVLKSREQERDAVNRSLDNLRQALWKMIETLGQTLQEEQGHDVGVTKQIDRLRGAVDKGSTEEIKREVLGAVSSLGQLADSRRKQTRKRVESLSATVSLLTNDLRAAKREAELDGLTRLHNRGALDDYLATTMQIQRSFPRPICLLIVDVDHFKKINDSYGHQVGDAVLRSYVDRLALGFPRRTDFLARYGGDEFVVILPDTRLADAVRLANRHVEDIQKLEVRAGARRISISVSIGLAELCEGETGNGWLARADKALYNAKAAGRNQAAAAEPA